jgi:hypothetical protein
MSQTARQTDKSTWWSITSFDDGEKAYLGGGNFPEWVAAVHGGIEKCPDTGREHFQGALQCRSQQRFSAIKKILPKSHIEPARHAEALRKYAMKVDTAVGEKREITNGTPYYTAEMLQKLIAITPCETGFNCGNLKEQFWSKVRVILITKPYLVGALAKPDTMRIFENTWSVWVEHMTDAETGNLLSEEAIVLQPPAYEELSNSVDMRDTND